MNGRDPDSSIRADRAFVVCSLLVGVFSLTTLVAVGYFDYTRLPWFDAWDHWSRRVRAPDFWPFLFSLHNEHRIPVSRLLYLADERWFHGDARLLLWTTFLAQAVSAVLVYRIAAPATTVATSRRLYVFGIVLAFAFAASQFINFTWTFQVCFVVVFCAAIAAIAALGTAAAPPYAGGRQFSIAWVAISMVMATVAVGSMANGLIVWPLMVLMAACLRLPKRVVGVLAFAGLVITIAYLHGYTARDPDNVSAAHLWQEKAKVAVFGMVYLGSLVDEPLLAIAGLLGRHWEAYRVPVSALVGAAGLGWFLTRVVSALRRPSAVTSNEIAMLHVLAFLAASSAMTALGRVKFPIADALTSRYVTPSLLFWAGLVASASFRRRRPLGDGAEWPVSAAVLVGAVFVGGIVQLPKVVYAGEAERYLTEGEYALINNVFSIDGWERFGSPAGRMIPVVRYFREHHLASFEAAWTRWLGDSLSAHFQLDSNAASDCAGAWESVAPVNGSYNPGALAVGWAYDRRSGDAPDRIVFVDQGGRIVGFAASTRYRPDLEGQHPEAVSHRVGWRSYLPASLGSSVTAYALLADGRQLCRVGEAQVPGSYWTVPAQAVGDTVAGANVTIRGAWATNTLPPGLAAPRFVTDTWGSQQLLAGSGDLRIGPVAVRAGTGIGLPVATGPGPSTIRLSVVDRASGEVLAAAAPPPDSKNWDLWRFDVPLGAPNMSIDYLVEQHGGDGWIVVARPRAINP